MWKRKDGAMKNKLSDLNNALFEEIERLQDDDLDDEGLEKEVRRASAVANIATTIISNGELALKAQKYADCQGLGERVVNPLLEYKDEF